MQMVIPNRFKASLWSHAASDVELTLARASCGRVLRPFGLPCLVCSNRKLLAVSMMSSGNVDCITSPVQPQYYSAAVHNLMKDSDMHQ